ncbi:MAG: hypothetical protein AB1778_01095 [Candidatus Bipolaricaulota bacterium]
MKKWALVGCLMALLVATVATSASGATLYGTRFNLGTEIQFQVEDSSTWWWGCCCPCTPTSVLGWRITSSAGLVVYNVVFDAPVAASTWIGSWLQVDAGGVAVPAGQYMLYVDTTAGTLSRCLTLYDPCACSWCYTACGACVCGEVPSITTCACRTELNFIEPCTCGCFSLFWWLGGCCSPCATCP